MEKDFRKKGRPAYVVERYYDDGELYNDESIIIYINGEYRGNDPIGRLMNDFSAVRADAMSNMEFAERMAYLKDTENGRREISGLREKIFEQGMEKGIDSVVLNMLQNGFDNATISTISMYPVSKVEELRAGFIRDGLLPA